MLEAAKPVGCAWRTLSVVSLASVLTGLGGSAINVALPEIARHSGADATAASWILLGYQLTTTVLMVVFGRLADMFGRRRMYLLRLATYTLAALLAGAAPGFLQRLLKARTPAVAGAVTTACGLTVLLVTMSPTTPYPAIALGLALIGLGSGVFLPSNTTIILDGTPPTASASSMPCASWSRTPATSSAPAWSCRSSPPPAGPPAPGGLRRYAREPPGRRGRPARHRLPLGTRRHGHDLGAHRADLPGPAQGHLTGAGTVADVVESSPAERHVYPRTVRFADVDSQGHVNNVRFLDYLEDARFGMFCIDPHMAGDEPFKGLVVTRHEIDYRRPLGFRAEPVRVESWVSGVRPVRFTLHYEIRDDDEVFVTATSVMAAYDVERAAPRRLSEGELAYLKRYAV